MNDVRKVVIVTGGSQGIGAGVVAGYRGRGWSVVASARTIKPSADPQVLTVDGDISEPFTDYTSGDYATVVGVNLTGFFLLTQRAITHMLRQQGGHVVNITATLADYANSREPAVLAALTKGGLAAATRSLAIEYASRGIRVNAVSPGIIQTPMHSAESYAELGDRLPPIGRVGQVADVVNSILFLESSPYVTGEIVHVDGGQIAGH
jgi:NAD(P)-dependent dehydrogenase (short-subunit alcohol dehydrogenase family)